MIQIDEQKLRQLFKNRSNCYADAEDVVQAMDEDCFIETVNESLRLFAVSGRSEQLKGDEHKSAEWRSKNLGYGSKGEMVYIN